MTNLLQNNKRIAKNTLILYFRMFLLMTISLYTSRITLKYLGINDYGIYNVVGGFVITFSILSSSMTSAISRYITVELGHNDINKLNLVFSTSINVQLFISIFIFLFGEIIGIWFLYNKMSIPEGRMDAALWVLHCSIIMFVVGLLSVPYNSIIIAYERMSAFAYISILEAILKLVISVSLIFSTFDKLKTFVLLLVFCQILLQLIYIIYCKRNFEECNYKPLFKSKLFLEIWSFAGWNVLGNGASILNTQGVNMLMNIFFGVTVNAARGIANQVNNAILQFVNNFTTAINPQIIKSYASGNKKYAFNLACKGAKYSYVLMLLFTLPVIMESEMILNLWLDTPPPDSVAFLNWTIIASLTTVVGQSLVTIVLASGNIRKYQIVITAFGILPFPLSWIAFEFGATAIYAFIIYFACYYFLIYIRIWLVHNITGIPYTLYFKEVILKIHLVTFMAGISPLLFHFALEPGIFRFFFSCVICILSVCMSTYKIVLNTSERELIINKIKGFVRLYKA